MNAQPFTVLIPRLHLGPNGLTNEGCVRDSDGKGSGYTVLLSILDKHLYC